MRLTCGVAAFGVVICAACNRDAPSRGQVLLVIDTDAPTVGALQDHPELSPASAVDTLRVDVVDSEHTEEFSAPDLRDWPISFGVKPPRAGGVVTLRLRLFRASRAIAEKTKHGSALVPRPETAIERAVSFEVPDSGLRRLRVLLSLDCVGVRASFVGSATGCVDALRRDVPASEGIETIEAQPETQAATHAGAIERPCSTPAPPDTICIHGGYSVLGDQALVGLSEAFEDPAPERPALVPAFYLDTTEFTVGRFKQLVAEGFVPPKNPYSRSSQALMSDCTWRELDAENDALPLNCVPQETAEAACAYLGGRLPSEAEFEHAARGRGDGRSYPWGNAPAVCCRASVGRLQLPKLAPSCPPAGSVEPPGSHTGSDCDGLGDVSRDGVLDLGGSLSELMRDHLAPYTHACWSSEGPALNPICLAPEITLRAARGGNWGSRGALAHSALRFPAGESMVYGFRCSYDGEP